MNKLIKVIATALPVFASAILNAQSFEGTIEFKKQTTFDTTTYIYYVKGDKVRIDEIGSATGKIEGTFLVDLKSQKMTSLSHERKIYMDKEKNASPVVNGQVAVEKTKNAKTVHEYKCTEYIAKNATENTEVSYWVAPGKFDFFPKLLNVLNRKDKFATYYQKLTGVEGMFPFVAIEKSGGVEKGRLEVTKIEKKVLNDSMFNIPADYKKFEK